MKPLVLITNDDGIASPGLKALAEALEPVCDLLIAAPKDQQTNMGRGALRGKDIGVIEPRMMPVNGKLLPAYAVNGSPAQSVAHALLELTDRMPDLCISGVNYGENVGLALTCSGTVGACFEADSFGVPGIAFSRAIPLDDQRSDDFETLTWDAEKALVRKIAEEVLADGLPVNVRILNVNFPSDLAEDTEIFYTTQAPMSYGKYVQPDRTLLNKGCHLGWEVNDRIHEATAGTDIHTLHMLGKVSVTPINPVMSVDIGR